MKRQTLKFMFFVIFFFRGEGGMKVEGRSPFEKQANNNKINDKFFWLNSSQVLSINQTGLVRWMGKGR